MTMLALSGLLFGVFILPLVLMYMLKMRHQDAVFSSLYLWERALRDLQANTPWQKLRRNLLFILQFLAMLLLVLALARPAWRIPTLSGQNTIVLLDASASMQATDVAPNRFESARQTVHRLIDTLPDSARMSIILAGRQPVPLISNSSSHRALHAALDTAAVENGQADWYAALALAASASQGAQETSLLIVSDGGLPIEELPPFPGEARYLPIGDSDANLSIAAFSAQAQGNLVTLFIRAHNYGRTSAHATLSIYAAQTLLHAETLELPAHGDQSVVVLNLPNLPAVYQASLHPTDGEAADILALDNTAFTIYQPYAVQRALLVTPGNLFLENILAALPGIRAYRATLQDGRPPALDPTDQFSVYIYDGLRPDHLPDGNLLLINPPNNPLFTVGAPYTPTQEVSLSNHPLINGLDWRKVFIGRARRIVLPDWGYPLVQNGDQPLVFAGSVGGRRVGVLAFDLKDSNLPLTIAYPVLFSRLMEYLAPGQPFDPGLSLIPGESVPIHAGADALTVVISNPDGENHSLDASSGDLIYRETHVPGVYAVNIFTQSDQRIAARVAYFAVNLFSPQESDVQPAATLTIPHTGEQPVSGQIFGYREFWPWLAFLAFGVLLAEWVIAHRR
ncbi:MAG: BatA and WFA domain-containing protein [Anaerolineales bacterium]